MTARELSTTQIIAIRDDVKRKLLAFAVQETGKAESDFVVRDAMAYQDFGLGSEKWDNESSLTSVTWTKDWSKELPKTKFVAFYGVVNHSDDPHVIGTKYKVGTNGQTTRDVIMHGRMRAEDVVKCFHEPVLYKGGETIYVEHYNESASALSAGSELIELLALVAEPYGEVISAKLPY
jgi:hypothetical protein